MEFLHRQGAQRRLLQVGGELAFLGSGFLHLSAKLIQLLVRDELDLWRTASSPAVVVCDARLDVQQGASRVAEAVGDGRANRLHRVL